MINALVGLRDWVDARLPIMRAWNTHMGEYYAPKNFNFWYFFGVLSLVVLINQLLTGIWLTMSYTPSSENAFAAVEYIMRDVEYGWLIRYMHSTGASAFFCGCLSAHVPRTAVRIVPEAQRTDLDLRYVDLRRAHGGGVRRIRVAMGSDVLLGSPSYYLAIRRDPGGR